MSYLSTPDLKKWQEIKLIAIGVSTGGPMVLQTILTNLAPHFPPIVIVQHISTGFLPTMVNWLKDTTKRNIVIATQFEPLVFDHVYFAPDNFHTGVSKRNCIYLSQDSPENGVRPAVSYLFRSTAENFGGKAMGVILTGMGRDGVVELKKLKESGAITVAQDKLSSIVHGMPGDAILKDAVDYVLTPLQIAELIKKVTIEPNK